MIKNLEQNYISVVLVINDDNSQVEKKIKEIKKVLDNNFKSSEIVIVDNTAKVDSLESLKSLNFKHTEIKLPIKHRTQQALNAGTAIAIGDYIVEIEDISFDIDYNKIIEMYRKSQEGYDFVFLTPKKSRRSSKIFYNILNKYFNEDINSSVMTLSSRRGQNKVAEVGKRIINRNVAYVLSGLKSSYIVVDMDYKNNRGFSENLMLMFDTLIYYTDAIMLFTQRLAFGFFIWIRSYLQYNYKNCKRNSRRMGIIIYNIELRILWDIFYFKYYNKISTSYFTKFIKYKRLYL